MIDVAVRFQNFVFVFLSVSKFWLTRVDSTEFDWLVPTFFFSVALIFSDCQSQILRVPRWCLTQQALGCAWGLTSPPPQLAVGHPSRMIWYSYFLAVSIFSALGASKSVPKLMAAISGFFSITRLLASFSIWSIPTVVAERPVDQL